MIPVKQYTPIVITDGSLSVATAGVRTRFTTANIPCFSITMTANSANTGMLSVGGSAIVAVSNGLPLSAGDTAIIEIDNLNKLYLDSTVNGEGLTYYYKA